MSQSAPTWQAVSAAWRFTPLTDLVLLAAIAGYLWMVVRSRAVTGQVWPPRRTVCALLAALLSLVGVAGPIARYAEVLFWVHMVQHLLLIMVVPVLLIWAQPLRLLRTAGWPGPRGFVERARRVRVPRWLSSPLVGLALYSAVVVLTHLTGFQQVSATHGTVRGVELVLYLFSGWVFFVALVGGELITWELPYLLRFVVLALGMGADTLTGLVLMLSSRPLAPVYGARHPGWGPTALHDQQLAGAIMWFGGDLLMMLLMILVAVGWGRAGADRQGLGSWLEAARRHAVLGTGSDTVLGTGFDTVLGTGFDTVLGTGADGDEPADLDSDQRALDAYNATLAALHGQRPKRRPEP